MTPSVNDILGFGPHLYGAKLHIDACPEDTKPHVVVDIETDEKDNFVGFAATWDGVNVYYFTDVTGFRKVLLESSSGLIGHNLKGDLKWLISWGVNIKPEQLHYDTCLASYVQNTTKESHGLKDLAKEYLGMEWPTYRDMVGSGKKKVTLDKQSVERVASYCGMDCLATYRLWQHFQKTLNPQQKRYLETIELPTARALLKMELLGVEIDVPYLMELDRKFGSQLNNIERDVREKYWLDPDTELNINSNRQIAQMLQDQGAELPRTAKGNLKVDKATLEQWKHLPAVPLLLEYSKIEKLKSTYTEALLEKQKNGRIYCNFNQITKDVKGNTLGISTGRLSSSNPNLQNIPARTEEGKLIRKAFVAGTDKIFIDADFSQIEPRLVAHFTKDKTFTEAYRSGRDIYAELVAGTGRDRQDGKTFMLALLYGAQPKKLASVFKCSEKEAEEIVNKIMRKLPGVTAWINRTKWEARQKGGVWTLFKRWIPLPSINSADRYERLHWERVAVNSVIQGSAAEIMKMSLIKLTEAGYNSVLTVHDEFLIEEKETGDSLDAEMVKEIMEDTVKLDVPLKAEVGMGKDWGEAKQ
jgi:DNA polymerase-1